MSDSTADINAVMGRYQKEVVRWNRQINLVSRQDTLSRVASLIGQCRAAWAELDQAVLNEWGPVDSVWYFDLGSGGGLPGYVWHQLMAARFTRLNTWLVEPREKRAWFLERLNSITPDIPVLVSNSRWGETECRDSEEPQNILISLKALHLTDPEVVTGLIAANGGAAISAGTKIAIARFYPPAQQWSPELTDELCISTDKTEVGGLLLRPETQTVLAPTAKQTAPASIVLSTYLVYK